MITKAVDRTATAGPPFNGYLYDLPRSQAFARSWHSAVSAFPVSARAANRWLVDLDLTAAPNEVIETPSGETYVLAWGCDPSNCESRTVLLVYNGRTTAVAAAVFLDGAWHVFGSRLIEDRATLLAQLARERLGLRERFPLPARDAQRAARLLAAARFE